MTLDGKTLDGKLAHYRLSREELELIKAQLGREPEGVEWAIYSAMWSEHCSYKSSRVHLGKFYNQSERVLQSFGENAGVIDLGEGEKVAFKMESHNHPSYISPHQGAATGVGGILRDIFTMGARPVALANYLCFGEPSAERMPVIVDGVVRGIGDYGNCVGVPNITGQTEFDNSYNGNVLVNALAVGLYRPGEEVYLSKARGSGNWVVYVGAKTGRDGVHGASMASESFDNASLSNKTTIQIGDPFYEKLLIESCLEVMKEDLVVAIQDMGAAGLTSSSFEMAASGGVGLKLYLDQVPLRDSSVTPEEILLSESQERMLLVCEPDKFDRIQSIFQRWGLDAVKVGEVQEKKEVEIYWHKEKICGIDPEMIVEKAPRYERPYDIWKSTNRVKRVEDIPGFSKRIDRESIERSVGSLHGMGRSWVYNQYDQRVGANTVRDCSHCLGVIRLPDSKRTLGLVLGCRPHIMRWDAKEGGRDAVAYPALQLAIKGFEPLAVTDCLNFGNPEKTETMSEFVAAVEGISEICEKLDAPVISGNVSFYNETLGKNITSTPSTGLVGLGPNVDRVLPFDCFQSEGELVYLMSSDQFVIGGRRQEEEEECITGVGQIRAELVEKMCKLSQTMALSDCVSASRVVGKYGLSYALVRMASEGLGVQLELSSELEKKWHLESYYQILWSVKRDKRENFESLFSRDRDAPITLQCLGSVSGKSLIVNGENILDFKEVINEYNSSWEKNIGN